MNVKIWHKSSYSATSNDCVEALEHETGAYMRDTKHRELGHLEFDRSEWSALLVSMTSK